MFEHLLITLGNIYETHIKTDQIKIMVLKSLMIISTSFNKLYDEDEVLEKNINKIRKLNNCIVHKDCIKFSSIFKSNKETNTENINSNNQINKIDI